MYERLEIHDTLQQGSWLNRAEIEGSVLTGPCLNRRIDWRFTTNKARLKLKKLYPAIVS